MSGGGDELQWVHGLITVVMRRRGVIDAARHCEASMGPRSDNRGYVRPGTGPGQLYRQLQWVHGLITVVMGCDAGELSARRIGLQWVHGLITVVMRSRERQRERGRIASMGPRSDNRGYGHHDSRQPGIVKASMGPRSDNRGYARCSACSGRDRASASMGPRSDNRGYVGHVLQSFTKIVRRFNGSTV